MKPLKITLAAARVNAGYAQEQAAKEMNVSRATIISWEKGRTFPTIEQARRLSEIYHIPLDYIFLPAESNLI